MHLELLLEGYEAPIFSRDKYIADFFGPHHRAGLDWPPKPPDLPTEVERRLRVVAGRILGYDGPISAGS